jgi:riboflavin biosynthesis pyrimidine reductase
MNEADVLMEVVAQMSAFESLVVDGGQMMYERAFKATTLDEVRSRIAERRAGERLTVQRYPDGFRLVLSRQLLV